MAFEQPQWSEQCNYWKTSKSSPDQWVEKAVGLIESFGGEVIASAFGNEHIKDRAAYMIRFRLPPETFRVIWPVMPSQYGDTFAARRQAATMMYHDIKAKCISAQILGARAAFFTYLELPDGRQVSQASGDELMKEVPEMLLLTSKEQP